MQGGSRRDSGIYSIGRVTNVFTEGSYYFEFQNIGYKKRLLKLLFSTEKFVYLKDILSYTQLIHFKRLLV